MPFSPFRHDESVHRHRLNLPHWRQWGRTYFITTRLADSIPEEIKNAWIEQRACWLGMHGLGPDADPDELPEKERKAFHGEFTARFHELLDAGHGACVLNSADASSILLEIMTGRHDDLYHLDCWVIMPNHFHALVEPLGSCTLGQIMKSWKGASAFKINKLIGKRGSLWQAEAFDHIVRSEAQLNHYRRYIARNPSKAGLCDGFLLGRGKRFGLSEAEMLEE